VRIAGSVERDRASYRFSALIGEIGQVHNRRPRNGLDRGLP
jgi:hypothetical protein